MICREDKGPSDFPGKVTDGCSHTRDVCRPCMARIIRMEISVKGQAAEVKCPTCSMALALSDVARESSQEDADQLDKFLLQRALSQEPNFCWCAHGCGVGQVLDEIGRNIFMTCQQCSQRTCTHHRSIWHDELTCAEHDHQQTCRERYSFTVDNSILQSTSNGVVYRRSPQLEAKAKGVAEWGTCVHGFLHSSDWVAVGDLFLPTAIRRVRVLQPRAESYQVDNALLQSSRSGVRYRTSPNLEDATSEIAEWGSFVKGTPVDQNWIKVDSEDSEDSAFLPICIRGLRVLKLQGGLGQYMQEKKVQRCPSCHQGIEKKHGCDHMKCPCGAEFCHVCGADYLGPDGIFSVGNHMHKKTCRHYRPWRT